MNKYIVNELQKHFNRTGRMLLQSILACPDEIWETASEGYPLWKHAYHAAYWLDVWMSESLDRFEKPEGFYTRSFELDNASAKVFTKNQVADYCSTVLKKCEMFFEKLQDEDLDERKPFFDKNPTVFERIMGQIRHVSYHTGYMDCILKKNTGKIPDWIGNAG